MPPIDYNCTVGCWTTYEYVFVYACHVLLLLLLLLLLCSVLLYCCNSCCSCCCCWSSCAGWQNFLLWLVASDSSVFLLFIQTRFLFNVPWRYCRIYSVEFLTYNTRYISYHTSSVIAGMCGAEAGISPPRWSPPCLLPGIIVLLRVIRWQYTCYTRIPGTLLLSSLFRTIWKF